MDPVCLGCRSAGSSPGRPRDPAGARGSSARRGASGAAGAAHLLRLGSGGSGGVGRWSSAPGHAHRCRCCTRSAPRARPGPRAAGTSDGERSWALPGLQVADIVVDPTPMMLHPDAGSARPRRLGIHATLWVLAAVVVTLLVGLAGVSILRNGRVHDDLAAARNRWLVPDRHLADAQQGAFRQEQDARELFAGPATGAPRAAGVDALGQDGRTVADSWTSYRRVATGVPDETRLQADFDAGVESANTIVTRFLAG